MNTPTRRPVLHPAAWTAIACLTTLVACAKAEVNGNSGGTGAGGAGGTGMVTPTALDGLVTLAIDPPMQSIVLTDAGGGRVTGQASFKAFGTFDGGRREDVTGKVLWSAEYLSVTVVSGTVTVNGPGRFVIQARSGQVKATATLSATFAGQFVGTGVTDADAKKLDGQAATGPAIAYPLDGAIFPANFGPITVQIPKTGTQDLARLSFKGEGVDVSWVGKCEAGPGTGCYVTLPVAFTKLFVAPSEKANITVTARLGSTAGGSVTESPPVALAWARLELSGGLYYWTTISSYPGYKPAPGQATGTGIMRYNFDGNASAPELVYSDQGTPPDFKGSPPAQDYSQCIGCHAISPDGALMALSIGGSNTSALAILDIGKRQLWELDPTAAPATAIGIEALKRKRKLDTATFTTFGPRGDLLVNMYRGQFTLRGVSMSLPAQGAILGKVTEFKTDPFWSEDGRYFAFTTFADPALSKHQYNPMGMNGDMKTGGQIWVATADQTSIHDDAQVVVPRMPGVTSYYPAITPDGQLMVFNRSTCGAGTDPTKTAGDYGNLPCDGYDDQTAALWLTTPAGAAPTLLARANGGETYSNSWPRWSPDSGPFRGGTLYWVAYSSRRPYGLQVNTGGPQTTKPQLWFAAVVVGGEQGGDPSFPPIWLPNQNPNQAAPFGNHVPQWVRVAVTIE